MDDGRVESECPELEMQENDVRSQEQTQNVPRVNEILIP